MAVSSPGRRRSPVKALLPSVSLNFGVAYNFLIYSLISSQPPSFARTGARSDAERRHNGPIHASEELQGQAGQRLESAARRRGGWALARIPRLPLRSRQGREPAARQLLGGHEGVRADGSRRADLDQEQHR